MAKFYGWAKDLHKEYKRDPEYITSSIVAEIIDNLAAIMDQKGISRAELARRLGKTRGYVTKLLRGYYDNLTIKTLVELAQALDEDINKFSDLIKIFGDLDFKWGNNFSFSYMINSNIRNFLMKETKEFHSEIEDFQDEDEGDRLPLAA